MTLLLAEDRHAIHTRTHKAPPRIEFGLQRTWTGKLTGPNPAIGYFAGQDISNLVLSLDFVGLLHRKSLNIQARRAQNNTMTSHLCHVNSVSRRTGCLALLGVEPLDLAGVIHPSANLSSQ